MYGNIYLTIFEEKLEKSEKSNEKSEKSHEKSPADVCSIRHCKGACLGSVKEPRKHSHMGAVKNTAVMICNRKPGPFIGNP